MFIKYLLNKSARTVDDLFCLREGMARKCGVAPAEASRGSRTLQDCHQSKAVEMGQCPATRGTWGTSLVVQWLRRHASLRGAQVWSLVRELASHMLCSTAKIKWNKKLIPKQKKNQRDLNSKLLQLAKKDTFQNMLEISYSMVKTLEEEKLPLIFVGNVPTKGSSITKHWHQCRYFYQQGVFSKVCGSSQIKWLNQVVDNFSCFYIISLTRI